MGMSFLKEKKIASFALGFLVLIFSLMEFYVVYGVIDFIRSLRFNNPFDGILSGIRFIFLNLFCNDDIKIRPIKICAFVFLLVVIIILISVLVTYIVSGVIEFIKKEQNKIKKENFIRVFGIIAPVTICGIVFLICFCVAILPALLITSMYVKGNIELYYCVFFDFMIFLAIISFMIYVRIPIWKGLENAILNKKGKTSDVGFKKLVMNFTVRSNLQLSALTSSLGNL